MAAKAQHGLLRRALGVDLAGTGRHRDRRLGAGRAERLEADDVSVSW
jgi:hypothetical protein